MDITWFLERVYIPTFLSAQELSFAGNDIKRTQIVVVSGYPCPETTTICSNLPYTAVSGQGCPETPTALNGILTDIDFPLYDE